MEAFEHLQFRHHNKDDLSFIYATWLNSYYGASYFAKKLGKDVFYDFHKKIIERILEAPITQTLIAASKEDPNTIFGYLVAQEYNDRPILQYVYVKGAFQRYGIAKALVGAAKIDVGKCIFTHWTFDCDWIVNKYPSLVYNPYLIS